MGFLKYVHFTDIETDIFSITVYLTYSLIYLLFSIIATYIVNLLRMVNKFKHSRLLFYFICTVAVITTAFTNMMIFADYKIFTMFGFHFNGFVWNLITTPGGIRSMGADLSTHISVALFAIFFVLMQIALLYGINKLLSNNNSLLFKKHEYKFRKSYRMLLICFLILTVTERITFGICHLRSYTPVIEAAGKFPFYIPLTFSEFAKKMGVKRVKTDQLTIHVKSSVLEYPLEKLTVRPPSHPVNVVWLVSESWRADTLTPEIMPGTYAFAEHAHRFTNHYSGGNGTRMGVFSMFYGVYGSYWLNFLNSGRAPLIMDLMQRENYQFDMFTSAEFTYPEFDRTVFVNIPTRLLHQSGGTGGFINDRNNVSELINFIKNCDKNRPFMTFMFFESPHSPYTFPEDCIVRKDYLPHINYAITDIKKNIELIHNRYINSVHHLDTQFERIFEFFKKEKLLENTIVVVTGDHGEEFMEKGHWGHRSSFVEEQIRVPLVIYIPGSGNDVHNSITSHIDIVPTIAPYLGIKNKSEDYCLGYDLLGNIKKNYAVVSDWYHIAIINDQYKYVVPVKDTVVSLSYLFTRGDKKIESQDEFFVEGKNILLEIMANLGRFLKKGTS